MIRLAVGVLLGSALIFALFVRDDLVERDASEVVEAVVQTVELAMREAPRAPLGAGKAVSRNPQSSTVDMSTGRIAGEPSAGRNDPPTVYTYKPKPVSAGPPLPVSAGVGDRGQVSRGVGFEAPTEVWDDGFGELRGASREALEAPARVGRGRRSSPVAREPSEAERGELIKRMLALYERLGDVE